MLFHAHPDDETISTGATMGCYAAHGVGVTVVTSTLGEEGEILVPALSQLAADSADQLGGYRIGELAAAMQVLGVADSRFLGGPGRYRDSGMMGSPANRKLRAFWRLSEDAAAFGEAVRAAVDVLRELRPQVVVTYDPNGDYGHPDHIMTHRVAMAAVAAAADPGHAATGGAAPWRVAKVYWTAMPRSVLHRAVEALRQAGTEFDIPDDPDDYGFGVADEQVSTAIENPGWEQRKRAALAAHATQISVDGPFFALSNQLGRLVHATEYFRLVQGNVAGPRDDQGRETDLFAGT